MRNRFRPNNKKYMSRSGTGAGNPFPCAARILKRIADVFQVWYLGRRANGDCGARDEWIAAHLTLDVLMWIALPRTETARTWADDRDRMQLGCGAPADSRGQIGRERALDLGQPAGAEMGIRS
jgi:hypothetical protein